MDATAKSVFEQALVWDAHSCLPIKPGIDVDALKRHRAAGIDYVSINVGMDFNPWPDCVRVLAAFRAHLQRHPESYVLVDTVADVLRAKQGGKLAVGFDLEGSDMLDGDLDMLRLYRDLGVRQIHFAYNRDNKVGGGCHGADVGLCRRSATLSVIAHLTERACGSIQLDRAGYCGGSYGWKIFAYCHSIFDWELHSYTG